MTIRHGASAYQCYVLYPSDVRKVLDQYRDTFGCRPRLWPPVTLNEHVQSSKLFCRNARYTHHGSGFNMLVIDSKTLDWESAKHLTQTWLETDFSVWLAEYQYRWIDPNFRPGPRTEKWHGR